MQQNASHTEHLIWYEIKEQFLYSLCVTLLLQYLLDSVSGESMVIVTNTHWQLYTTSVTARFNGASNGLLMTPLGSSSAWSQPDIPWLLSSCPTLAASVPLPQRPILKHSA